MLAANPRAAGLLQRAGRRLRAQPALPPGGRVRRSARSRSSRPRGAGWGLVGLNQLREGEIDAGRANLEKAFARRSLQRLVQEHARPGRQVRGLRHAPQPALRAGREQGRGRPAGALRAGAGGRGLRRAGEALRDRRRRRRSGSSSTPRTPTSRCAPSVSPGMGALGVCFGKVIAQDSPRARPQGHFNWGSTLWHELAHTFTLAASDHRVPRWLTEGLSVLEERRARPGWGDDLSPLFLAAWRDGELLPVGELNNGFVRPNSPEQIGLSYYQASLVVELIERDWGKETILGMLHGYRDNLSTEEILQRSAEDRARRVRPALRRVPRRELRRRQARAGAGRGDPRGGWRRGRDRAAGGRRSRGGRAEAAGQLPGAAVVGDPPGAGGARRRTPSPSWCAPAISTRSTSAPTVRI